MAINYGSNEVKSSGRIIGGDGQSVGRTLYFYSAVNNDWNTLGNWFVDRDHTLSSDSLPTDEDTAVILSDISSNSGSFIADTIIFDNGDLNNSFNGYTISEVRHIILINGRQLAGYGTIGSTGTRVQIDLYDNCKLYFSSSTTIYGDVNFHETSYIDNNSQSVTIEGNVVVTSSGGNSNYQPIYGNGSYSVTILGDLRVVGNSSSTTTIRYVKVLGKTELFENVKIMDCPGSPYGFYGPVTLTDSCIIDDNVYFYNDVTLNEGSIIEGSSSNYFYSYSSASEADYPNSKLTLNTDSYFASNSYINMYGGTLIMNTDGDISNGSSVTINGDVYTTVEFRTNTGNGFSGNIYCGTLKVFNDVSFGANSMPTLSSSIMKKIQFFNSSKLHANLTVPDGCVVEFYDDSNIANNSTLTLGSYSSVAIFHHRSFILTGCSISNGSYVVMTDYAINIGTIGSDFAFFKGQSANGGTINNDASFSDSSVNSSNIGGSANFDDWSINTGDITGDAIFNGFSKHMGPLSNDGGTADSASYDLNSLWPN